MPRSVLLLLALLLTAADVAAQDPSLLPGGSVQGSLAAGDTIAYTVDAEAEYFVLGDVDQRTVDVQVRILDPDGRQLRRIDGPGRGPEVFFFETEGAGRYRIEVIPDGDEEGDYEISLDRLEPLETDPAKLVDQLMSPYDRDDMPGAAVAVWRDGRTLFSRAYGMANLSYRIPFEVDTRTNIGSTSKQFTAFAVMLQAERGELSLDDDIRTHVPELPDFGHTITVRHLLTHTSGLREFLNLLTMEGRRLDHGDYVDRAELIEIVRRQPALQNVPGTEWNYNNTAFGLAALIVERTSGQEFHEFMEDNVFAPLGMTRTMVRPTPEHVVADRSQGYDAGPLGLREVSDLFGAAGAGGIYTTLADLQRWVENYDSPRIGSREIFDEMMTSYVLADGDSTGYGYGLGIDRQRGLKRVHHGGADAAHRSMLAYYPEIAAGITAQSNHAGFSSAVAFRLAEAFFGDAMAPEEVVAGADRDGFDPSSYDPGSFDEMVGRYALDAQPAFIMTFTREGDTLHAQATGQPRLEVVPTSDSTFTIVGVEASIVFHRNAEGEVDALTLTQGGQRQHATRLAEAEPDAWEPTVAELEALAGRYFSDEVETFYTITLREERLVLSHRRRDDAELTPGEQDTFTGGGLTLSFERDRSGRVIGFYMSNVRTRDVRFERVR